MFIFRRKWWLKRRRDLTESYECFRPEVSRLFRGVPPLSSLSLSFFLPPFIEFLDGSGESNLEPWAGLTSVLPLSCVFNFDILRDFHYNPGCLEFTLYLRLASVLGSFFLCHPNSGVLFLNIDSLRHLYFHFIIILSIYVEACWDC